jgi:hypothetical protein
MFVKIFYGESRYAVKDSYVVKALPDCADFLKHSPVENFNILT